MMTEGHNATVKAKTFSRKFFKRCLTFVILCSLLAMNGPSFDLTQFEFKLDDGLVQQETSIVVESATKTLTKHPSESTKATKIDAPRDNRTLHIYWINAESAVEEREHMTQQLGNLRHHSNINATLVSAVTVAEVKAGIRAGRIKLTNSVELVDTKFKSSRMYEYTFHQAAHLVSHLTTILQAYRDGRQQVLVLQDDAIVTPNFVQNWHVYEKFAPSDWTILQWTTTNLATLKQGLSITDQWISWLPDLHGTHAYQINRKGMYAILRNLCDLEADPAGDAAWTLSSSLYHTLLADEILFSVDQTAYTSTFPWVLSKRLQDTVNLQDAEPNLSASTRNESVLGFMNVRFDSMTGLPNDLENIRQDVMKICHIHRHAKCRWIIKAAVATKNLDNPLNNSRLTFDQAVAQAKLPSYVQLESVRSYKRFNKFAMLEPYTEIMNQFDLVLFKDSDQNLAGFPWVSFLERKGNALVSGCLRQSPLESFLAFAGKGQRQGFSLHDARDWKAPRRGVWNDMFVSAVRVEVQLLEMYFDVFDGAFAKWFFPKILVKNFIDVDVSWGPDFLWCPAAKEYGASLEVTGNDPRVACALVPLVSVHKDTRQLKKDEGNFWGKGEDMVKLFGTLNDTRSWSNATNARGIVWMHQRALTVFQRMCRMSLGRSISSTLSRADIQTCLLADMSAFKK